MKEEEGCTVLQMEKNNRTRLEVMKEHKKKRMEELKNLISKDRELCRIICTTPFSIDQDSVPSLQQLKAYQAYLEDLTKEKVPPLLSFLISSASYLVLTMFFIIIFFFPFPGAPPPSVCEHQKGRHSLHELSGAGARDQF